MSAQQLQVKLRPVEHADLESFYQASCDSESIQMAKVNPRSREAFDALWESIFTDPQVVDRAIVFEGEAIGLINGFFADDELQVGYWIYRTHWGKGIATRAMELFLGEDLRRPMFAVASTVNAGSIRVLERNGFEKIEEYESEATDRYIACPVAKFVIRE